MRSRLLAVVLVLVCWISCLPAAYRQSGDVNKLQVLDEVTVQAHRQKLSQLRQQIKKSVDDFSDAFNKANTVAFRRRVGFRGRANVSYSHAFSNLNDRPRVITFHPCRWPNRAAAAMTLHRMERPATRKSVMNVRFYWEEPSRGTPLFAS
jgi:hypothetical protein